MADPSVDPRAGSPSSALLSSDAASQRAGQDRIWDFFQNEAPESFAKSTGRVSFLARRIRAEKVGARVLNVGVGAGTFERVALENGLDVYCLDPNERTIQEVRSTLELGDRARVGYGEELPFEDEFFDSVVMSEVLEHLPDETQRATLAEVQRVLRKNGLFLGTVPAREDLALQHVVCPDCGSRFHRWGHLHSFDQDKLQGLLSERFEVEEIFERSFVLLTARQTLFGNLKRLIRLGLMRLKLIGASPDTIVLCFRARKA